MNVLVIGSGGREHALAWKIAQSPLVQRTFVAPGNAGTELDAENVALQPDDFSGLIKFARQNQVQLTVVGPEQPLCQGIVDAFQKQRLPVFGPSRLAAELEGSKGFCKNLLRTANVPTPDYRIFADPAEAERYVRDRYPDENKPVPLVVKADGLAAGKGAIVCHNRPETLAAIELIARQRAFGMAGDRLVIEQKLEGPEVSVLAITDGRTLVMLPPAQDHKRALDGDRGPNTGGMGAYCPTPLVDEDLLSRIQERVLIPTVHTMNRSRRRFRGVLYAGLMLTAGGPKVLEYNVRFGDPECQPLLMRLKSDIVPLFLATIEGRLAQLQPLQWDPRPGVCVVMASEGYPGPSNKGDVIRGLDEAARMQDVKVFHAGTRLVDGQVLTAGGRVLGVTALGQSTAQAKRNAYQAVKCIRWNGAWCRKDISDKALQLQLN